MGGASFDYDALEQLTQDPTRGLSYAYDYKGQLVTEDRIGDTPGTLERRCNYGPGAHGSLSGSALNPAIGRSAFP